MRPNRKFKNAEVSRLGPALATPAKGAPVKSKRARVWVEPTEA